jgi:hypothetical protein
MRTASPTNQRKLATHLRQAEPSLESWWSNTLIRHNGSKTWLGLMHGLPSGVRLHKKETGAVMVLPFEDNRHQPRIAWPQAQPRPRHILIGDIAIVEISHTLGTTLGRIGGKELLGA